MGKRGKSNVGSWSLLSAKRSIEKFDKKLNLHPGTLESGPKLPSVL